MLELPQESNHYLVVHESSELEILTICGDRNRSAFSSRQDCHAASLPTLDYLSVWMPKD
jgi:hypothetical protein